MMDISSQPKVSVIIPVYGVENYISSAIESVLSQTYSQFELLIVDDGSPDRSVEICQQFTDSRIRIIRQANRGLSGARNTGIRHAQGEYIAFLDGDDCWQPQKLECHIQHLEASPKIGVSFSFSEFMSESGIPLGNYVLAKTEEITLADLFRGNPVGNGSAAVFRKAALAEIEFENNRHGNREIFYYDEDLRRSEDHELLLRIAIQTDWEIAGIPEALTLYRVNSGGLSANFAQQHKSWEQVLEKTYAYAPDLIKKWRKRAMAYHMRYLSRNAVRFNDGDQAFSLIQRSLILHWPMLLEQPRQSWGTLIAACILKLLPAQMYCNLEVLLRKQIEKTQRQRMI